VDYVKELRTSTQVPVFIVTQGQYEIGQLQGMQLAALLPRGGAVLFVKGPSLNSVATKRLEGMETTRPQNVQLATLRSKWNREGAYQSVVAWLRLETSRAEKFDLVAGQSHELVLGARKAFEDINNPEQKKRWLGLPYMAVGIPNQVKRLVDEHVLAAAVVTSVTTEVALRLLVRAIESHVQPPERSIVEMSSYPALEKLTSKP
jgi:ABC-type sugar transport system substrate-binding protein